MDAAAAGSRGPPMQVREVALRIARFIALR